MFIKINSDAVINTNYITAIEPYEKDRLNSKGNKIKYVTDQVLHYVIAILLYAVFS